METTSEYTVRVKLRGEQVFREYPNAVSWAIENGICSVANGSRVNCWPIEMIEEWDVPRVPISAPSTSQEQGVEGPPEGDDWYQV